MTVEQPKALNLSQLCEAVDRVLAMVAERLPGMAPAVRDWNDRLLIAAVARGYRCLGSIRDLACSGHFEDASALTRVLVSLTIKHLWLGCVEDEAQRRERLRQAEREWARGRAILGEELLDLGYLTEAAREGIAQFRERADQLGGEGVQRLRDERAMAIQLDRELQPTVPRFFELAYARIFRTTSEHVHFGLGAAIRGDNPALDAPLSLEKTNDDDAAEALGLALVTYGFLLDFSEPIIGHGLAKEVEAIIKDAHAVS